MAFPIGGGVINRVIMTSDSKGFEKLYPRVLNYLKVEKKNKNEELKNIEIPAINTESIKNEKEIKVEPENEINLNTEKENTEIVKQEEVESKKEEKNTIVSHQVTTQKEKSLIQKITKSVTNFFQQILNLFK